MHRRRLLTLVAAAPLFSGCSTISPPGSANSPPESTNSPSEDSVLAERGPPSRDELPTESRPPAEEPPDATEDTVSPRDYPPKLLVYTDQSVRAFVESHERAYLRNDVLARTGGTLVAQSSSFNWTVTLEADGNAGIGRCEYRTESAIKDGDYIAEGSSHGYIVVTYYVDDQMIVRAKDRGGVNRSDDLDPDPWESGVVLEPSE